jgi:hypothetical protein
MFFSKLTQRHSLGFSSTYQQEKAESSEISVECFIRQNICLTRIMIGYYLIFVSDYIKITAVRVNTKVLHVWSIFQFVERKICLSSSEARSGKSLGTRLGQYMPQTLVLYF